MSNRRKGTYVLKQRGIMDKEYLSVDYPNIELAMSHFFALQTSNYHVTLEWVPDWKKNESSCDQGLGS